MGQGAPIPGRPLHHPCHPSGSEGPSRRTHLWASSTTPHLTAGIATSPAKADSFQLLSGSQAKTIATISSRHARRGDRHAGRRSCNGNWCCERQAESGKADPLEGSRSALLAVPCSYVPTLNKA